MKNLFKALAAFQQEVPTIHKDTQGYGYTYAELSTILEKINPLLKKHGLGFTQPICGQSVKTIIFHAESGETIECATDIPQGVNLKGMNEFQVLGSAITYIRRYALSSALGLVTDKDNDAAGEQQPKAEKKEDNKQWLNKGTPAHKRAIEVLKSKEKNLSDIKAVFKISKDMEAELLKVIEDAQ
jgi:hypothetical protein